MVYLPKGSIMQWAVLTPLVDDAVWLSVTEHNRAELNMTPTRIETSKRMASGTMRKYVIADKWEFSTSWTMLPDADAATVDGKMGGASIEQFWKDNPGAFWLKVVDGAGVTQTFLVMFTAFNKTINKRGKYDAWDVDVTLEEV